MNRQLLFIQGGGVGGFEEDAKLVATLQAELGAHYLVHYPNIITDQKLADFGWLMQIGDEITRINGEIILAGHSLGAAMLLKFISENKIKKKIAGIFLLATPFWSGNEDWVKGLKLKEGFEDNMPKDIPVFLYHCHDDAEVPFEQLLIYRQKLPAAFIREIASGGHQLNDGLSIVAKDIKSLKKTNF